MKTKQIPILCLIILSFFLAGCQKQMAKPESTESISESETFKNLLTYRSKGSDSGIEYPRFEIQYPEEIFLENCVGSLGLSFNQNDISDCGEGPRDNLPPIYIMVKPTFKNDVKVSKEKMESSIDWYKKSLKNFSQESIAVGSYEAVKITGLWQIPEGGMRPELNGTKEEIIYIAANNAVFEINFSHYQLTDDEVKKYQMVLSQILATFEFIE